MRFVYLGSQIRPPASFPPRLTATQLPSTCGWCHQPPQGTRTPKLLIMLSALPRPRDSCRCRRGQLVLRQPRYSRPMSNASKRRELGMSAPMTCGRRSSGRMRAGTNRFTARPCSCPSGRGATAAPHAHLDDGGRCYALISISFSVFNVTVLLIAKSSPLPAQNSSPSNSPQPYVPNISGWASLSPSSFAGLCLK